MDLFKQQIEEAIKNNLPSQVGEILKERLELLEDFERQEEQVTKEINDLNEENDRLNNKLYNQKQLEELIERQETNAKELKEKERNQKIFELEVSLNAEKRITESQNNFLYGLVRNIEYRKSISNSKTEYNRETNQYETKTSNSSENIDKL